MKELRYSFQTYCFNPSQVQFTQAPPFGGVFYFICFNPSQVQFTPSSICSCLSFFGTVSIPHRFNSHQSQIRQKTRQRQFQSLTGSIHTTLAILPLFVCFTFQSLTGSIHTITLLKYKREKGMGFNPSQVQFTLLKKNLEVDMLKLFQSLTGSIHTCCKA